MTHPDDRTPRDAARPADYYRRLALAKQVELERILRKNHPGTRLTLPDLCLSLGLVYHAAGRPVADCLHWFGEAATHTLWNFEFYAWKPTAYTTLTRDLELFPAAALAGRVRELVAALRRCRFERPAAPRVDGLIGQLCAVLNDEPAPTTKVVVDDIARHAKPWRVLPPLLAAAAARDEALFAPALGEFLKTYWPRVARAGDDVEYVGHWSLLATALCARMGHVPALPPSAQPYIAAELITASSMR